MHPLPPFDVVICARNNRPVLGETLSGVGRLTGQRQSSRGSRRLVPRTASAEFVRPNFDWVEVHREDTRTTGRERAGISVPRRGCAPLISCFSTATSRFTPRIGRRSRLRSSKSVPGARAAGKLVYADASGPPERRPGRDEPLRRWRGVWETGNLPTRVRSRGAACGTRPPL